MTACGLIILVWNVLNFARTILILAKMEEDVELYLKPCVVCQQDRTKRKKIGGLRELVPIPERLQRSLSMDFIIGLPKVDGFLSILLIVDKLSKYATSIHLGM